MKKQMNKLIIFIFMLGLNNFIKVDPLPNSYLPSEVEEMIQQKVAEAQRVALNAAAILEAHYRAQKTDPKNTEKIQNLNRARVRYRDLSGEINDPYGDKRLCLAEEFYNAMMNALYDKSEQKINLSFLEEAFKSCIKEQSN